MEPPVPGDRGHPEVARLTADRLTGLPNEHVFRLRLPEEFRQAREREANAALLVVKLDNLVALNARQGRNSGDEALRAIAYVLENYLTDPARSSHLVFRLGGPFFAYYAPQCSAPEARALAEEIRDQVQQSDLYLEPLTVSIGLANLYEFFLEEGTAAQIAQRIEQTALRRLELAEQQGTNTICDTSSMDVAVSPPRRTVLVVEPEPASLDLLVRALQASGLTVVACEDGEGALSLIEAAPPGVILCEAMTPRLNGFTIRERLRANALWNGIPFILMSHRKNEELIRKAVELDIRHYFRKPLCITEVAGLIVNLTRHPGLPGGYGA
jgi:diguanylate cyclase (GGDEF)-like protein